MPRKPSAVQPYSTNVLDYPSTMSGFEKESLAAEAKLMAEQEKKNPQTQSPGEKPDSAKENVRPPTDVSGSRNGLHIVPPDPILGDE